MMCYFLKFIIDSLVMLKNKLPQLIVQLEKSCFYLFAYVSNKTSSIEKAHDHLDLLQPTSK